MGIRTFKNAVSYSIKYLPYILIPLILTFIGVYALSNEMQISRQYTMLFFGFFSIILLLLWIKYQNIFSLENFAGEMKRGGYYCNILFFIVFSLSLLTIHFRENLYQRPNLYFLLIFICIFLVLYEIFTIQLHTTSIAMVIMQIILLNLNILLSQYFLYPTISGIDPWFHQVFTYYITDFSHVAVDYGQYSSLPLFHILNATIQFFTMFNYKLSVIIFAIIIQAICFVLVIFLIGKKLFHERIGLLAALGCLINSFYLGNQGNLVPFAFSFIFVVFILFLFIRTRSTPDIQINIITILFFIALLFTNPLPAFFLIILLSIIIISFYVYNRKYESDKNPVSIIIVFLFYILFMGYYMFSGFSVLYYLFNQVDINLNPAIPIYNFEHINPVISNELASFFTITQYFYFFLSLIGILYLLNYRSHDFRCLIIFLGVIISFGIGFSGTIINLDFENFRWVYFASFLNSILFALSLFLLYNIIKKKYYAKLLLILFISFIFFNSIVSVNPDNNIYSDPKNVRYVFTESEITSLNTLSQKWEGIFASDRAFRLPILFHREKNLKSDYSNYMSLDPEYSEMRFEKRNDRLLIIRDEIRAKMPMSINRGNFKLNYDPVSILDKEHGIKLFNSGSIYAYSLM